MTTQTAPQNLLAWLNNAITAREDAARWADSGAWSAFDHSHEEWDAAVGSSSYDGRAIANCHMEEARHIAANEPRSVLRRCARDRKLLELHGGRGHSCPTIDYDGDYDDQARFYDHEVCPVVQGIAEGYGWTADA